MPSRVAASMSMCEPALPVCEIKRRRGSFSSRARGKLGAFADQHQHFGITQPDGKLAVALDGVGEDLGIERIELAGAPQLSDGVLVIVEDDDVHGARGAAHPARTVDTGHRSGNGNQSQLCTLALPATPARALHVVTRVVQALRAPMPASRASIPSPEGLQSALRCRLVGGSAGRAAHVSLARESENADSTPPAAHGRSIRNDRSTPW